jgi:phosphohistidine phosphatase SixA
LDWLIEEALAQFDQALLLGHNNGMEDWVLATAHKALSGFPTAAVTIFRREGSGVAWRLKAFATPEDLAAVLG